MNFFASKKKNLFNEKNSNIIKKYLKSNNLYASKLLLKNVLMSHRKKFENIKKKIKIFLKLKSHVFTVLLFFFNENIISYNYEDKNS